MRVVLDDEAAEQLGELDAVMVARVTAIFERLASWPAVSGAKPLRHELKGSFRVRSGSYRVLFRVAGDTVIVWRIDNRRDVYE